MLNIGDRIEIKKKETTLEQTFNGIVVALESRNLSQKDKLDWCESALNVLEMWFNNEELDSVKAAKKTYSNDDIEKVKSGGIIGAMANEIIKQKHGE